MKKDIIETKVDKLLDYINMRGEVTSVIASEALDIPLEQIEEWAKPLEDSEMIKIKYSPLQGMILVSNLVSAKELKTKVGEFKNRKEELKKVQEKLEGAFAKYEGILPELDYEIKEISKGYAQKLKEAKSGKAKGDRERVLKELEFMRERLESHEKELSALQGEKNELNRLIDTFKKDLLSVDKRSKAAPKSKEMGGFYEFLSKSEKDMIDAKKNEEKFIHQVIELKKKVESLVPEVQTGRRKAKRAGLLDMFKFWK